MAEAKLQARKRSEKTGTSEARRYKHSLVPGIIYGGKETPENVSVELRHILKKWNSSNTKT